MSLAKVAVAATIAVITGMLTAVAFRVLGLSGGMGVAIGLGIGFFLAAWLLLDQK